MTRFDLRIFFFFLEFFTFSFVKLTNYYTFLDSNTNVNSNQILLFNADRATTRVAGYGSLLGAVRLAKNNCTLSERFARFFIMR